MNIPGSAFLFFTALILCSDLCAQNLVPNGSFEEYRICPGTYNQRSSEFQVNGWRSINAGSPDYFNTCSEGEAAVPYNWAGVSDPFDGFGYAGIYVWMNIPKEYREYLHCKLAAPLKADSLYQIEFRYKLSSYSKYCTDRIGVLLSDSLKTFSNDRPLDLAPTVTFVKDSALTPETGGWELALARYRAKGNEQFLTLGNFSGNADTHYYHIRFRPAAEPMLAQSAYYYIDDVKVTPVFSAQPEPETPPAFTGKETRLNTLYVLKNIQFEFNSHALRPVSHFDLDRLVDYLKNNADLSVRLAGHTDEVGDEAYNLSLSLARAGSVKAYLVGHGVDARRIAATGYGERQPLVQEETEAAREVNRRVEIEFFRH